MLGKGYSNARGGETAILWAKVATLSVEGTDRGEQKAPGDGWQAQRASDSAVQGSV